MDRKKYAAAIIGVAIYICVLLVLASFLGEGYRGFAFILAMPAISFFIIALAKANKDRDGG